MIIDNDDFNLENDDYKFNFIQNKILNDLVIKNKLIQWGLSDSLKIIKLRFNIEFSEININKFILNLFNNEDVKNNLLIKDNIKSIEFNKSKCTSLNTNFLDKLYEYDLIMNNGEIKQNFSNYYDDIEIIDKIREMLLIKDSELYEIYSDLEREEFLFKLFKLIHIGGNLNQYDTNISFYKDILKKLYKQLVSINLINDNVIIDTVIFNIKKINDQNYFKFKHDQNILNIIVNKTNREVFILFNTWSKYF